MVNKILSMAGFIDGKTYTESRFIRPPKETYAIYLDYFEVRGSDFCVFVKEHNYTIELYSTFPDVNAEHRIENAFKKLGMPYTKEPMYFIQSEQLYQTIYSFECIEKLY